MKDNLISLLNDVLLPLHFKRKGNNWVNNGAVLSKIVNFKSLITAILTISIMGLYFVISLSQLSCMLKTD